jgi:hypothetical protein
MYSIFIGCPFSIFGNLPKYLRNPNVLQVDVPSVQKLKSPTTDTERAEEPKRQNKRPLHHLLQSNAQVFIQSVMLSSFEQVDIKISKRECEITVLI